MKSNTCRVCKEGILREATVTRTYRPNDRIVEVELLESRCDRCDAVSVSSAQHSENLRRLAARKASYGDQLMGEEYVAFRKRYGLTQRQASKIVGKGLIAFSRYENEETYPDASTRLLIEIAMTRPEILKGLADKAGIEIPLWKEREEERVAKQKAEQEQAERNAAKSHPVQPESSDTGLTPEELDIWLIPSSVAMVPYEHIHMKLKNRAVTHKSSSLGHFEAVLNRTWLECSRGAELLSNIEQGLTYIKPQHYVFSDEPFSLQIDPSSNGDVSSVEVLKRDFNMGESA